jgi:hypothetical protein
MPREHIDTLLWRTFRVAENLLRDLENAESNCDDRLDLAGRFLKIVTDHVEPLRRVVEAVEDHERADAEAEDRALARMSPL